MNWAGSAGGGGQGSLSKVVCNDLAKRSNGPRLARSHVVAAVPRSGSDER